jgi:hypothetical protein
MAAFGGAHEVALAWVARQVITKEAAKQAKQNAPAKNQYNRSVKNRKEWVQGCVLELRVKDKEISRKQKR